MRDLSLGYVCVYRVLESSSESSAHCVKHKAHRHVLLRDIWYGLGGQLRNLWWGKFSKLSPLQDSVVELNQPNTTHLDALIDVDDGADGVADDEDDDDGEEHHGDLVQQGGH